MKGIVWAGGDRAGLARLTHGMTGLLLPVYDKPMIYHPLSVLLLAGLRDLLVIAPSGELDDLRAVLGDGRDLGVTLAYAEQDADRDRGQAFDTAPGPVALVDADGFVHGAGLSDLLRHHVRALSGGVRFHYAGQDAGLGFFPHRAAYHDEQSTKVVELDRRFVHHRTASYDGLLSASRWAQLAWRRDGVRVGCVEEAAWRMGFIDDAQLLRLADRLAGSGYGTYLANLVPAAGSDLARAS